jgi:hypothetical protein
VNQHSGKRGEHEQQRGARQCDRQGFVDVAHDRALGSDDLDRSRRPGFDNLRLHPPALEGTVGEDGDDHGGKTTCPQATGRTRRGARMTTVSARAAARTRAARPGSRRYRRFRLSRPGAWRRAPPCCGAGRGRAPCLGAAGGAEICARERRALSSPAQARSRDAPPAPDVHRSQGGHLKRIPVQPTCSGGCRERGDPSAQRLGRHARRVRSGSNRGTRYMWRVACPPILTCSCPPPASRD